MIYELDTSTDLLQNITWQYDKSPALITLINAEQDFFNENVRDFFNSWVENVFNLKTANRFGLLIWAVILGCTSYMEMTQRLSGSSIGFKAGHQNFFQANFGVSSVVTNLSTPSLRKLLTAQMLNFNSNGSIADINRVLAVLFAENRAYASMDIEKNTLTFNFPIALDEDELGLVLFTNILPAPIGVKRVINNGDRE